MGCGFISLARGSSALARIQDERLGPLAMANGVKVGLAVGERRADGGARLISLELDRAWRRRDLTSSPA